MKHLPNILTWLRLLSAPVLVAVFFLLSDQLRDTVAAAIFLAVALTDWLDGFLARLLNMTSRFGQFLDPVADKIAVTTALLLLLNDDRVPLIAVLVIIGREICMLGLREWMADIGRNKLIVPMLPGKVKTAFQMAAIVLLLLNRREVAGVPLLQVGEVLLWVSVVLTVASMGFYLRIAYLAGKEQ